MAARTAEAIETGAQSVIQGAEEAERAKTALWGHKEGLKSYM